MPESKEDFNKTFFNAVHGKRANVIGKALFDNTEKNNQNKQQEKQ